MIKNLRHFWVELLILVTAAAAHFAWLTRFPVFADESIYIRWAQLITESWQRYLFFPLNDGKTPLFIWLLVPGQIAPLDPLWAARAVSVISGLIGSLGIFFVLQRLGAQRLTQRIGLVLSLFLPFWFTYHHFSLMDGLMTTWLTWATYITLGMVSTLNQASISKYSLWRWKTWPWRNIVLLGGLMGLAILTKLPALLFWSSFVWMVFFLMPPKRWFTAATWFGSSIVFSGLIFATLKIHPAFSQLFRRSSDFLYPLGETLSGGWLKTITTFPAQLWVVTAYLTLPIMLLAFWSLFAPQWKRTSLWLWCSSLTWIALFAVFGKTVYPRYFLPAAIGLTLASALGIENVITQVRHTRSLRWQEVAMAGVLAIFAANSIQVALYFDATFLLNPNNTPFVAYDQEQYLREWSSGHGIPETMAWIHDHSQTQRLAVATEGSFGTLPDAILMYLHHQDVSNIYVEGIGQPVVSIPPSFIARAKNFDQVILVVNSHRNKLPIVEAPLIFQVCRPSNAPCLQVVDITKLVKNK